MFELLFEKIQQRAPASLLARVYNQTPRSVMGRITREQFRSTVRWAARHSPFYKRAFAERGIDPRAVRRPEDLGDFYTTPEDLQFHATEFLCRPPSIVFESSGTSGRNKQVYYGEDELRGMGRMMAGGFYMMGMRPEDRVANAFDFSIWIPGMLCHYGLMAAGNFHLAFGKVDPAEVLARLATYRFTVVMGEPTWLIRLTELAERQGAPPLKMLIGGAEEMPEAAVPWMERVWGGAKVKMCYGSVEAGSGIGFQPCDFADGYHLDDVDYLPELIEPDAEGYGEFVFTTLRRRVMPLIRYRTRDVTRLLKEPCACGSRAPRMTKLRGRRDELVVASGGNLYPKMFEEILSGVPGLSLDWQVVFKLEGIHEVMEIHVESDDGDDARVHEAIQREAARKYPDLMKNLALGIFEMRTRIHPLGEMRSGRKLKRIVDLRHHQGLAGEAEPHAAPNCCNGKSHKE